MTAKQAKFAELIQAIEETAYLQGKHHALCRYFAEQTPCTECRRLAARVIQASSAISEATR